MGSISTQSIRRFKRRRDGQIENQRIPSIGASGGAVGGAVTNVLGGYGIDSTGGSEPSISFDGSELTEATLPLITTNHLVGVKGSESERYKIEDIPLSIFNNDAGFITSATGINSVSGSGPITSSGALDVTVGWDAELLTPGSSLLGTDYILALDTVSGSTFRYQVSSINADEFSYPAIWDQGGMSEWFLNTDALLATKRSIQEGAEVFIKGGTGIELTGVTYNSTDLRWEYTISSSVSSYWITSGSNIYYSTGFIGIGTNSIVNSVTVDQSIGGNFSGRGIIGDDTNNSGIKFYDQTQGNMVVFNKQGTDSYGNIILSTGSTPTERMRIANNGFIGIGEAGTPKHHLHVHRPSGYPGEIMVQGGNVGVTTIGEINAQLLFGSNDSSVQDPNLIGGKIASITESTNGANVGMAFYTYDQTYTTLGLTKKMQISNEGDIWSGIGQETGAQGFYIQHDDHANGSSQRLLFGEGISRGEYGFSIIYAGDINPTFGGQTFTLAANKAYLIMHNASTTGRIAMSIDRIYANATFFYSSTERMKIDGAGIDVNGRVLVSSGVYGDNNASGIIIYGGNGTGGHIELYGSTHASLANRAYYDADLHTMRTAAGGGGTTVHVSGAILHGTTTNHGGFDSDNYSASVTVKPELLFNGASLSTNFYYFVKLVTTATGTNTGYNALVYTEDGTNWLLRVISYAGINSSNHPQLEITSNVVYVRTTHANNYNIACSIQAIPANGTAGDGVQIGGADAMWVRKINDLYYEDGDISCAGEITAYE